MTTGRDARFRFWLLIATAVAGCGGPLAKAHLMSVEESKQRVLFSTALPRLDQLDAAVRSWAPGTATDVTPVRDVVFGMFSVPGDAMEGIATDHPVSIAATRADMRNEKGDLVPTLVSAIAFTLKRPGSSGEWLKTLGVEYDHVGPFYIVHRDVPVTIDQGIYLTRAWQHTGSFYLHVEGDAVLLANDLLAMQVAGPAAKAAWKTGSSEIVVNLQPQVLAREQKRNIARGLANLLTFLRQGRPANADANTQLQAMLAGTSAFYYLRTITDAPSAELAFRFGNEGVDLHLRTQLAPGVQVTPPLRPALDHSLLTTKTPAAFGSFDCNGRLFGRQPMLNVVWRSTKGPGSDELDRLVQAEEKALEGSCAFVVRTDDELWSEEASYPLRPDASADALSSAMQDAIRSGGWPNLESGLDDLETAQFLLTRDKDVWGLDRVLGATTTKETRHAAALHGGATLHDRFAVRGGRFLATSGVHAAERIEQIAKPGNGADTPLPAELERALASGRGQGGIAYLDLTALWKPYLKAAQVIDSPLGELVTKVPDLFKTRRPMVITVEPTPALDATVTMPPATFGFVFAIATLLFAM
jgi:hypothetical protein